MNTETTQDNPHAQRGAGLVASAVWFASLVRTLHPRYWLMNHQFNRDWDNWLNEQMDSGSFEAISAHTARIGGRIVWIENHPYASFTNYGEGIRVRPSRRTIIRAHDKLIADMVANNQIRGG